MNRHQATLSNPDTRPSSAIQRSSSAPHATAIALDKWSTFTQKIDAQYSIRIAQQDPLTSDIATLTLSFSQNIASFKNIEVYRELKEYVEHVAQRVQDIFDSISRSPLKEHFISAEHDEPPLSENIRQFYRTLLSVVGSTIDMASGSQRRPWPWSASPFEHYLNGLRSHMEELEEVFGIFEANARAIRLKRASMRTDESSEVHDALLFYREHIFLGDKTPLCERAERLGVPSFWSDTFFATLDPRVTEDQTEERVIVKQYSRHNLDKFREEKRITELAWDFALPQLRGYSSDDVSVPFLLFRPIDGEAFPSFIEELLVNAEDQAESHIYHLLLDARDAANRMEQIEAYIDTNTIRDSWYDKEDNGLKIPPVLSHNGQGKSLSAYDGEEDLLSLARELIAEVSDSPRVKMLREERITTEDLEAELSRIEKEKFEWPFQFEKPIDWLDRALRSKAMDKTSPVYGRALLKLRDLLRHRSDIVFRTKPGEGGGLYLPQSCYFYDTIEREQTESLSRSAGSDVFVGTCGKLRVAVKVMRVNMDSMRKAQKDFYNEVITWKYLQHPNITPFLGVYKKEMLSIVSPWMNNGSIIAYLRRDPTQHRIKYLAEIVDGLQYLHGLEIIHGDLKGANIFVSDDSRACLADFGLATAVHATGATTTVGSHKGTRRWMAPELFMSENGGRPTTEGDIYALGMTMWEVFTLQNPFPELSEDSVMPTVQLGDMSRPRRPLEAAHLGCIDAVWDTMRLCWRHAPKERPTIAWVFEQLRRVELAISSPTIA